MIEPKITTSVMTAIPAAGQRNRYSREVHNIHPPASDKNKIGVRDSTP